MGLRHFFREVARPFEKAGQKTKEFFTGPDYDKMAEEMSHAPPGTYGTPAPTGPVGSTGGMQPFGSPRPNQMTSSNDPYGRGGFGTSPTYPGSTFPSNPYGGGMNSSQGGMSSYEKWLLALQIGGGVLSGYNQWQSSKEQAKQNAASLAEQQREFNVGRGQDVVQRLESAPLRDRASYLLQARMGLNPEPFQGETLTQHAQGGLDPRLMAQANSQYKPGMGGTNDASNIYKKMLEDMGYHYGG